LIPGLPPIKTTVEITDPRTLKYIERLEGIMGARDAILKSKSPLPGVKFALTCVDCEAHEMRIAIFSRFAREAAKAGIDLSRYGITGFNMSADGNYVMHLRSFESIDSESEYESESESESKSDPKFKSK
jgi:hypothetical protein